MDLDLLQYLMMRLFPQHMMERNNANVQMGYLKIICAAIMIDNRVFDDEVQAALELLIQLHQFQEYDKEELRVSISLEIERLKSTDIDDIMTDIVVHLEDDTDREIAFKIVAFLNESDGRVVPIEGALLHSFAKAFAFDEPRIKRLFEELDAEVAGAQQDRTQAQQAQVPQNAENNPFLAYKNLPQFERVKPAHLVPAMTTLLGELEEELAALELNAKPTWEGVVEPLERLNVRLSFAWGLAHHLLNVKNSPALRKSFEQMQPQVVSFSIKLGQSQPIYEALSTLLAQANTLALDEAQIRIVEALEKSARHSGIGLTGAARDRFNAIQGTLAELSTKFSNNVLDATNAFERIMTDSEELAGLPKSALTLYAHSARQAGHKDATVEKGPWRITLDGPSLMPILRHSQNRALRKDLYMAHLTRASSNDRDNTPVIDRILALRQEEAKLLGYQNYAQLSLSTKMASDVDAVYALLGELRASSFEAAQTEHASLEAFAHEQGFPRDESLKQWDLAYFAELQREALYGFSEEKLRPYFPFTHVLNGLFSLIEDLFSISIEPAHEDVSTWHKDVQYFKVYDRDKKLVATFYLDPFSRPDQKRGGAWHGSCQGRSKKLAAPGHKVRLPISYLVCNQTPPIDGQPSLMTFNEVRTLFHEFGHGLQHMLTRVDYGMASGINNIEWDAVELPSQFMENWVYQPRVMRQMTSHVDTGEPIPKEYIKKLIEAKNFRAGNGMLRQLYFSLLDMKLHDIYEPGGDTSVFELQREVAKTTSILPLLSKDRFLCAFAHIFAGGYSAGYYSYKWAEVLSADAFSAFEEAGLDNIDARAEIGQRFRDTVLAMGGGRHPSKVFEDFRGRAPASKALLKHQGLVN